MLRTLLYTTATFGAAYALYAGTTELGRRDDARRLTREAEQALSLPLMRAPELGKIPAARAVMLLDEAVELHEDPHTRGLLAWAHALDEYQKSRFERAQKALTQARSALPKSVDLELLEAAIAMREGHLAAAAAPIASALAMQPQHPRARLLAADLAADRGDSAGSMTLLQGLIAQFPKLGPLYNRRGLAYEALGDTQAATADFLQATRLDGSVAQPYINLGRLERIADHARDAETAFAHALERSESDPEAWLGRGLSRIALGDLVGGALDVQRARDLAPAEPAPLVALADIDARRGQLDAALGRYRAALLLAPGDAVAWLKLGNTLTRKKEFPAARTAFERALQFHPGLGAAHNGLGAVLMALGDAANAEKEFATAAELDSRDPNPLRNLALLRKRQGDLSAAGDANAEALARADGL